MTEQVCYVAHDNGRVTAIVSGPRDVTQPPESSYVEYAGDQDITFDYYVHNEELVLKPDAPSSDYVFDYASGTWTYDLSAAKHEAWSMIKVARDMEEFGTFTWSSHTFQCDEISQRRIQSAVQSAQLDNTVSVTWTLSDNTTQVFNATELQQIGQALSAHINACHDKARAKRSEINAATTEEQINSVSW